MLDYSILKLHWDPSIEAWSRIADESRIVDSAIFPIDGGVVFLGGSHEDKAVPTARAWNEAGGWSELPQPRTGWTTRESPRLGTPRLFRMANGGIVCVQDEDAQILASIWETPVA